MPTIPRQLPDHWHDGVAAHWHPEQRPKVTHWAFVVVLAAATHFTVGQHVNQSAMFLVRAASSC